MDDPPEVGYPHKAAAPICESCYTDIIGKHHYEFHHGAACRECGNPIEEGQVTCGAMECGKNFFKKNRIPPGYVNIEDVVQKCPDCDKVKTYTTLTGWFCEACDERTQDDADALPDPHK